jgi:hypothetical protein
MLRIRAFAFLAAILLAAVSAGAAEITYTSGGQALLKFDVPDGWKVTRGGDIPLEQMPEGLKPSPRVYSIRPPDEMGLMWTGIWVPSNARNAKEFATLVRSLPFRLLEGVRITYRDERVVNGKKVTLVAGQGRRYGTDLDIVFAAVQLKPDRLAVICFIGQPAVFDRWEADLSDMLATVRLPSGETP